MPRTTEARTPKIKKGRDGFTEKAEFKDGLTGDRSCLNGEG